MCLIAFAVGIDPVTPLLIASNRDEYFERPTAPLHCWTLPNGVEVVSGRDLRDGGTWLGVSALGRVAMLTNVRSADMRPKTRSRGDLANRWLTGDLDSTAFLSSLSPADYGGFNLVIGDALGGLWVWASNRNPAHPHASSAEELFSRRLPPGLYGLSNATLDSAWPKSERLKQALAEAIQQPDIKNSQARLLHALGDRRSVPPGDVPKTGVSDAIEEALSSPFVQIASLDYGTRSSLLVRAMQTSPEDGNLGWHLTLNEWTHAPQNKGPTIWSEERHQTINLRW